MRRVTFALVMTVAFAVPAAHADPRYADWPCVQAKVPELSPAALWAGPPLDDAKAWANDPKIKDLVARLAARRVPIEDAQKLIADFMIGSAAEREAKGKLLFAGVMNFVIFPMFFASSALYPLWRVLEASPALYWVCQFNPFTHAVEFVRFALYGRMNWLSFAVVCGCTAAFMIGAILAYDPARGLIARRGGPGGDA